MTDKEPKYFFSQKYYVQQWICWEKHWFDNFVVQAIPNKGKEGEAILNNHLSVTYGTRKYLEGVFSNNCKLLAIPLNKAYLSKQFEYAYKTSWLLIFRFSCLRYKQSCIGLLFISRWTISIYLDYFCIGLVL